MEDSMINMPDLVFDDKIGNKRVRDGEDEIHKGRLEKRPSGILGGGDYTGEGGDEGGGIIDTFISNVFHKNKSGTEGEVEADVFDVVVEDEDKREDLVVDGGDGGGEGGGGIISSFFSNIFQHNNGDGDGDARDGDKAEESDHLGGGPGGSDGGNHGGGPEDVNEEKLSEKKDEVVDLPSKDAKGDALKLKPDDYSERVFFLNNN